MVEAISPEYPDLGVMVQKKYLIKAKDPYVYFTKGKVSRLKFLYNSVLYTLFLFGSIETE
jgi:hypothetical protein